MEQNNNQSITGGKWMGKQEGKGKRGKKQANILDDVIRTLQERHGGMLVPLVNETFHEYYLGNTPVGRLPFQ